MTKSSIKNRQATLPVLWQQNIINRIKAVSRCKHSPDPHVHPLKSHSASHSNRFFVVFNAVWVLTGEGIDSWLLMCICMWASVEGTVKLILRFTLSQDPHRAQDLT